jgi:hypothetical protein
LAEASISEITLAIETLNNGKWHSKDSLQLRHNIQTEKLEKIIDFELLWF